MADGPRHHTPEAPPGRVPLGPAIGTLVFVALVPGTVVGVVPWLFTRWTIAPPLLGIAGLRWLGGILIAAALPLFVLFNLRFVVEGHGTPAPVAPTRFLVRGGPFRWVRNPGYVSVAALVAGQGLVFGSGRVLAYAAALWLGFHVFVLLYEEPTLRRTFGADYDAYCRAVPRWLPRPPRA